MTDFRPDQNLGLVALKSAWPDRDEQDKPDWIVTGVDDGGVRIRPLVWDDLIEWVERQCRGDVR